MGEVTHTSEALVDGELATPETREVALSGGGDRRELWERWFGERKLGGQTPRRRDATGSTRRLNLLSDVTLTMAAFVIACPRSR